MSQEPRKYEVDLTGAGCLLFAGLWGLYGFWWACTVVGAITLVGSIVAAVYTVCWYRSQKQ